MAKIQNLKISKKGIWMFVIAFAIVGAIILYKTLAASVSVAYEAESATVSGSVTKMTGDSTASNNAFIRLGAQTTSNNVTLPARATFYYPWYPETWCIPTSCTNGGSHPHATPSLGEYDSSNSAVVDNHIRALDYAKIKVGIASWWGPNTHSENTRIPLLMQRTQAAGSNIKWTLYYEKEGTADPSESEITSDLNYISTNYGSNASYANVNGKPVIFVYNAGDSTGSIDLSCSVVDKWNRANKAANRPFYIVLKVFSGFATCASQPDAWHQYAPANAVQSTSGKYYTISPGFWRAYETTPVLARDPARWLTNVQGMTASNAPWQLVTSFNEWGEGQEVESATDWASASGYGTYLDALHNN